jgi:hypothetical protein
MASGALKYGYSTPLGTYAVFFNQAFALYNAIDRSVRWKIKTGFMQFPFDGGCPNLSKFLRFKFGSDGNNPLFFNFTYG